MDMCVEQTHEVPADQRSNDRPMRYTDSRMDEQVGHDCWRNCAVIWSAHWISMKCDRWQPGAWAAMRVM